MFESRDIWHLFFAGHVDCPHTYPFCFLRCPERIGFYNWSFKIPRWFDEGLAMQNDYRNYYSEDTLKVKSNNYRNLPDVKKLKSGKQFNEEGSQDQIMINFMTAKHEVKKWYTKEKLDRFIKDINSGNTFDEAFGQENLLVK